MTDATRESKQPRAGAGVRGIERRLLLRQGLSLGALTLLTGCDVTDTSAVQSVLNGISSWNDRAQAALFNPRRLMPTYPESAAVKDFRWNAYFTQDLIPKIDGASFKLNLSGLIDSRRPWTLQELYALPQQSQVTRHVCVEGWSMIGKWTGVPFRTFLARIGADTTAKCRVRMRRRLLLLDRHGLGAASADLAHLQDLRRDPGAEIRLSAQLRVATKLGFKNRNGSPRHATDRFPAGSGRIAATTGSPGCEPGAMGPAGHLT